MLRVFDAISITPEFIQEIMGKKMYLKNIKAVKNRSLDVLINEFMCASKEYVTKDISPGGHYSGVWCRDASFILDEIIAMNNYQRAAELLKWIWTHQIRDNARVIYARGSPENNFMARVAHNDLLKEFSGALPTSIHYGFDEVYATNPDIDSTALIIATTCNLCLRSNSISLVELFMPKVKEAIRYLSQRDIDNDMLLEQGPNEDWMDNMLRKGKILYSQATWLMALIGWANMLKMIGKSNESDNVLLNTEAVQKQIERIFWNGSHYIEMIDTSNNAINNISQDISLYLLLSKNHKRVMDTLDAIRKRLWYEHRYPLCKDVVRKTAPLEITPYTYQNGAIWPWITSIECMAWLNIGNENECKILLAQVLPYAKLEWINPFTLKSGTYPFRTGIAAIRILIRNLSNYVNK
jgi:glycogen debranching enzyme